jgi:hypothetical protein
MVSQGGIDWLEDCQNDFTSSGDETCNISQLSFEGLIRHLLFVLDVGSAELVILVKLACLSAILLISAYSIV